MKTPADLFETSSVREDTGYEFFGRHLLATYEGCAPGVLLDHDALLAAMSHAIQLSNATVLRETKHQFDGGGFTAIFLLAESHASIHTYPEHNACFVDFFTCGDNTQPETFDECLRMYLKPARVKIEIIDRHSVGAG